MPLIPISYKLRSLWCIVRVYRVIGRERIEDRPARFLVEFSRPWPKDVKRIYLIGDFTSLYPGYKWLDKKGDRGYAVIPLWPGVYAYGFIVDGDFENVYDPENSERICFYINFHPDHMICLSKVVVNKPADPLDDVYHFTSLPNFLHRFMDKLVIRFKACNSIEEVLLETIDGEKFKAYTRYPIGSYTIYEYRVGVREDYRYRFELLYRGQTIYYGSRGVGDQGFFHVELSNIPGYDKPLWYMGTTYYQIFVDSFENGNPSNDPPRKISKLVPREYGYYGGDLKGIIKRVNHLIDLGVETLYLTPINPSTSYHRYDIYDYKGIDKYLGTLDDFKTLISLLHKNDIKLVLDMVMHHASPCLPEFVDVIEKWSSSKYYDWFLFRHEPPEELRLNLLKYLKPKCRIREIFTKEEWVHKIKPFYEGFFNSWTMVKFNHRNPEVLGYFLGIAKYWMNLSVDGFRLDVAMGIHEDYLARYYESIKSMRGDFLVLAEISEHPSIYSHVFDSMMNYYLRRLLFELLLYNRISLREFIEKLNELYTSLPIYQVHSLYNMLGSHDTPRVKTLVNNSSKLRLLYALLFTLPGSPAIYYGDEIGMDGGPDPDNRRPMIWDKRLWDNKLYGFIKKLVMARKKWFCLRIGFYEAGQLDESILLIRRFLDNEFVIGIFNVSDKPVCLNLSLPSGEYFDILGDKEILFKPNMKMSLGPYEFLLLGRRID